METENQSDIKVKAGFSQTQWRTTILLKLIPTDLVLAKVKKVTRVKNIQSFAIICR
jgi:hypothetical protein